MQAPLEYLVAVGAAGALGRFVALPHAVVERGDEVLVKCDRGLERGVLLRRADPGHLALPYQPPPGELLRKLTAADRARFDSLADEQERFFAAARGLAAELNLPLEVVDVEATLEPRGFLVHFLRFAEADLRPWTSRLSTAHAAHVHLYDLTNPEAIEEGGVGHVSNVPGDEGGCSSCGSGGGGCGSDGGGCGTEGGCGSGCGTTSGPAFEKDWQAYFAELREQMHSRRISLPM